MPPFTWLTHTLAIKTASCVYVLFFLLHFPLSYAKKMWKFAHRINDKFRKSIKPLSGLALRTMTTTTTMMENSNANALSLPNTMRYLASAIVVFSTVSTPLQAKRVPHCHSLALYLHHSTMAWNCFLANAVNLIPKRQKTMSFVC